MRFFTSSITTISKRRITNYLKYCDIVIENNLNSVQFIRTKRRQFTPQLMYTKIKHIDRKI